MRKVFVLSVLVLALAGHAVSLEQKSDVEQTLVVSKNLQAALVKQKKMGLIFSLSAVGGTIEKYKNGLLKVTLQYPYKVFDTKWSKLTTEHNLPTSFTQFQTQPSVHVFSDRPFSMTSKMSVQSFQKIWTAADSFLTDPPNAIISYGGSYAPTSIPVTLFMPGIELKDGKRIPTFISNSDATVTFWAKPINPEDPNVTSILGQGSVNIDYPNIYIDGWFHSITHWVSHAAHTVAHAVVHTATHIGDTIANHVVSAADRAAAALKKFKQQIKSDIKADEKGLNEAVEKMSSAMKKAGDDISHLSDEADAMVDKVADDVGDGIVTAYDDVKAGIVWLYDEARCYAIIAGAGLTEVFIAGSEALATDGTEEIEWEAVMAMLYAAATAGAAEWLGHEAEEAALHYGANEPQAGCIGDLTDILVGQAAEMGSLTAFLVDVGKEFLLSQAHCDNIYASCLDATAGDGTADDTINKGNIDNKTEGGG